MNNSPHISERRILIKGAKPHLSSPPCTSRTTLGSAQEVTCRFTPSPFLGNVNKAPPSNRPKDPPSFSAREGHQLSCLSLTKRTVCCPPLDAISTARFSSCLPVIFTGPHSSSSSPVPSCRLVPIPQAYTDPAVSKGNSKWTEHQFLPT